MLPKTMMMVPGNALSSSGRLLTKKQLAVTWIACLLLGLGGNNGLPAITTTMALAGASTSLPPLSKITADHYELAQRALVYLNQSTDPFHAVQASIDRLVLAGFQPLTSWNDIQLGGKYYYTRNRSTLANNTIKPLP
jgi:Aminopeptidase I zinc metalloprotease (M18)